MSDTPSAPRPLLSAEHISASYGPIPVLFDVSLQVDAGEIVALLGTNGAGKTTVLRTISGVLPPTDGQILLEGEDITGASPRTTVERGIVQLPGGRGVFPGMTVRENLELGGYVLGRNRDRRERRIEAMIDEFPILGERIDQLAGTMSGGQQQMLALAKAMIPEPRVLLIDELSLGLAPAIVAQLLDSLRAIVDQGTAIVIVEQHVDLALEVASRAYFMERGQVRFDGAAAELHGRDDLLRSVFLTGAMAGTTTPPATA